MLHKEYTYQKKIDELREREKELRCLYRVDEVINSNKGLDDLFEQFLRRIPYGWQYPEICRVKITFEGKEYKEAGWTETNWMQQASIVVDEELLGMIEIYYTEGRKLLGDSPFLPEEQKLLNTIANLVSNYIFHQRLLHTVDILEKKEQTTTLNSVLSPQSDTHWRWRNKMTNIIAKKMDFERFGIKGLYLIGSTKNATAGPASDIDLLIHVENDQQKCAALKCWLEGWSLCLSEINYVNTGYKTDGLIDLHLITDDEINNKTSYAVMIGASTDAARPIKLK